MRVCDFGEYSFGYTHISPSTRFNLSPPPSTTSRAKDAKQHTNPTSKPPTSLTSHQTTPIANLLGNILKISRLYFQRTLSLRDNAHERHILQQRDLEHIPQ